MFDHLSEKLSKVFQRLNQRGALREDDVADALREVRLALLDADVALPVVKDFIADVRSKAVGQVLSESISPGQQVVKIVHDALVAALGGEGAAALALDTARPAIVLMVGLQGSGKTTTCGKLALWLNKQKPRRILLAGLDTQRPAAQLQLHILAEQAGVSSLPIVPGETPVQIAERAVNTARRDSYDIVVLDTAGRLTIDDALMEEARQIRAAVNPTETLLVVDAMTGQDAVNTARVFNEAVGVTGIVMTRMDGDARGGAALSMRAVTGAPIKLMGLGEKLDALEPFHPERVASRILDMGDIVSLVEKVSDQIDAAEAEILAKRLMRGQYTLEDYAAQLRQIEKLGSLSGLLAMLPGMASMKKQIAESDLDMSVFKRQRAIIGSMTIKERRNADIIKASRKRRIAAGSGVSVQEVNQLLKQFETLCDMMKKLKKLGQKGLLRHGLGAILPQGAASQGGGVPRLPF